jgi:hypothetical protein
MSGANVSRIRLLRTSDSETRRFANATGISALSCIENRNSEIADNTSDKLRKTLYFGVG